MKTFSELLESLNKAYSFKETNDRRFDYYKQYSSNFALEKMK